MVAIKISVIIVNYNVKYYVEQCLYSLQRALQDIAAEVFVVDNASADGSVEYLTNKFPHVTFISSNHNLGFAVANNMAIKQSCGKYVLLINPDTIVAEDTIQQLISFMDSKQDLGAVGVRMITTEGLDAKESRRGIPTPLTAFYKMSGLCTKYPKSKRFARYYMGHLSWDKPERIEIVSGAFCAVPRKVIDNIGLLDELFFMYGEDIDWSYRILKAGYHNWYLPLKILHYKGESTHKSSFKYVHVFYNAMLIFFKKHFGGMSIFLSFPIELAIYSKATITLLKMQIGRTKRNLGLFRPSADITPLYIFIGQKKSIEQYNKIAKRKALKAKFVEADYTHQPTGHIGMDIPTTGNICIVYDVEAYQFKQIFNIFAQNPQERIKIGTYNPHTQIVITATEILK